ncbi:hypothetical protein SBF1_450017 [Candidatus Desulfosporosinus infrequens]|uniref:Uncharacterized protein n=1 Tax=Candidatus Desulfosporosinus infrequens TaxID=2043169 RepID=A0A2U3LBT6_9FIRM|nr:hypothetical protein SBF1_450017 [Candidatus Desulfosporosinus infrequens]
MERQNRYLLQIPTSLTIIPSMLHQYLIQKKKQKEEKKNFRMIVKKHLTWVLDLLNKLIFVSLTTDFVVPPAFQYALELSRWDFCLL